MLVGRNGNPNVCSPKLTEKQIIVEDTYENYWQGALYLMSQELFRSLTICSSLYRRCSSTVQLHHILDLLLNLQQYHIRQDRVLSTLVTSLLQDILQVSHRLQMLVIRLSQITVNCHLVVCSNNCGIGSVVQIYFDEVTIVGREDF